MNISSISAFDAQSALDSSARTANNPVSGDSFLEQLHLAKPLHEGESEEVDELQEKFRQFVGNTLYGQMLKSMRNTVGKPAYMHGGRTEEVFQQQLDQILVEDLTKKSADTIADPMFELFNLRRKA